MDIVKDVLEAWSEADRLLREILESRFVRPVLDVAYRKGLTLRAVAERDKDGREYYPHFQFYDRESRQWVPIRRSQEPSILLEFMSPERLIAMKSLIMLRNHVTWFISNTRKWAHAIGLPIEEERRR